MATSKEDIEDLIEGLKAYKVNADIQRHRHTDGTPQDEYYRGMQNAYRVAIESLQGLLDAED